MDEVVKHQDFTKTTDSDPIADEDRPSPWSSAGEMIVIKSRALVLVGLVLGVAAFAHTVLAVNGIVALIAGLAVVTAIVHPKLAIDMFKQLSGPVRKLIGK